MRLVLLFSLLSFQVSAQLSDSLVFNAFYALVMRNHPVAKQAALLPEMARSEIRSARGAFDPILQTELRGKTTKGDESYTYLQPQLKMATRLGVELKAGMDQSSGPAISREYAKIDPTTNLPVVANYQLLYAGVNVPLLRGMFTDQRRTELQKAKLVLQMNEAEQVKEINKLFLKAAKEFWNWQAAYARNQLMKKNLDLAENRLSFIRNRILGGEEKPIDSVEALVEYRRREALLKESELDLRNAVLELSNYLWDDDGNPIQLPFTMRPSEIGMERVLISADSLGTLVRGVDELHPEVQKFRVKLQQARVERRLSAENLKPQLNVEYYPFQTYTNSKQDVVPGLFEKNYKFGVSFYSSLFLRKERGKFQLTGLKIRDAELDLKQGRRELSNQVIIAYNELENWKQLLEIQEDLVKNARWMREAEETRFEAGESSLFLVNQRERALIEAQVKQVELNAKYASAKYQLQFASGRRLW